MEYRKVLLNEQFQFTADSLLEAADERTKLIFLCSPNNPTGNDLEHAQIEKLLTCFDGLVVVDEAYIDFSSLPSFATMLNRYPNLIVLQTFSKAWGCAAIRLGMAFASPDIIAILSNIKYPYNVNLLTQQQGIEMLSRYEEVERWVQQLNQERGSLMKQFAGLACVLQLFPSDANFFLVRVTDACGIYSYLVSEGIIIRNRHSISLCGNCLRVTVGTADENQHLVEALTKYKA